VVRKAKESRRRRKNALARSLGVCEICERDSVAELGIFLAEGEILFETLWPIFFTLLFLSCPKKNWYRRSKNSAWGFVFFGPETRDVLWSRSEKVREFVVHSAKE
jgi:hypothetical protein